MKISIQRIVSVVVLSVSLGVSVAFASDPTGTWTWQTVSNDDGRTRTITLKLEMKDGQLVGVFPGAKGETPVSSAAFKDDTVSFALVKNAGSQAITITYSGKLEGDSITGSSTVKQAAGEQSYPWKATRAAVAAAKAK